MSVCLCEQVVNWLEGPGTEQLRTQWGIGDSIRASQALQQKHEEIESQHSVSSPLWFVFGGLYNICKMQMDVVVFFCGGESFHKGIFYRQTVRM